MTEQFWGNLEQLENRSLLGAVETITVSFTCYAEERYKQVTHRLISHILRNFAYLQEEVFNLKQFLNTFSNLDDSSTT